ncbi:hypothetical protein XELAEV_18031296mg [Xenopus laevis]|uniref:Uncharacterized protein n=1 Tax=Xenopus laevis TaxID=8355 RepID=A0A974CN50_XENLA|nr:hypothetical protein XELAEV_18031296mg [Xenopus laevis]
MKIKYTLLLWARWAINKFEPLPAMICYKRDCPAQMCRSRGFRSGLYFTNMCIYILYAITVGFLTFYGL